MLRIFVFFFRFMPVVIFLIVIAIGIYYLLSKTKTETIAKAIFIKIGLGFNIIAGSLFLLITLYAVLDNNWTVIELSGSCVIINAVFLGISYLAKRIFLKHRPYYQWKKLKD